MQDSANEENLGPSMQTAVPRVWCSTPLSFRDSIRISRKSSSYAGFDGKWMILKIIIFSKKKQLFKITLLALLSRQQFQHACWLCIPWSYQYSQTVRLNRRACSLPSGFHMLSSQQCASLPDASVPTGSRSSSLYIIYTTAAVSSVETQYLDWETCCEVDHAWKEWKHSLHWLLLWK